MPMYNVAIKTIAVVTVKAASEEEAKAVAVDQPIKHDIGHLLHWEVADGDDEVCELVAEAD